MKKFLKPALFLILILIALGYGAFTFNLGGLQDRYYGSRYFRPYAELKQEQLRNQIVLLKDNRILLIGWKQSEIFNPETKASEMVAGLESINGGWDYANMLVLADGNILITAVGVGGMTSYQGAISCRYDSCPVDHIPIFNVKLKKIQWIPSAFLRHLSGHTLTLLPNGKVLVVGGVMGWNANKDFQETSPKKPYVQNGIVIFDPKTYESKAIGHLQIHRYNHQAVLIDAHRALVFGGTRFDGNVKYHLYHHRAMVDNSIELINLDTGQSRIIGKLQTASRRQPEVFPLGDEKFLIAQNSQYHGVIYSEIFDLNHPEKTELLLGPEPSDYWSGVGTCAAVPNKRFICIGSKGVRDIDPLRGKNRNIDQLATADLSEVVPIYVPKIGLLIFGISRNILFQEKTIQRFNEKRYTRDYK